MKNGDRLASEQGSDDHRILFLSAISEIVRVAGADLIARFSRA